MSVAARDDVAAVEAELLATCEALRAHDPAAAPVAFWDFDGTLFEGDCSEGFQPAERERVTGLAQEAVEAGWSARYPAPGDFARCWEDYLQVMEDQGNGAAYAFLVQIFAGSRPEDLLALARNSFDGRLRRWFYPDALRLWRALEAAGARNFVISASADFFVKGAAAALQADPRRLHGVRLEESGDGVLRDTVAEPLTFGDGKAALMTELLRSMAAAEPDRKFYTVAAFGNHWSTDGPLLEAAAREELPVGQALAVLVNTAPPDGSTCRHRCLTFSTHQDF